MRFGPSLFAGAAVAALTVLPAAGARADDTAPTPSPAVKADGSLTLFTKALVVGGDAYVIGPPELVTDAAMQSVTVSPDGKAALMTVTRRRPALRVPLPGDPPAAAGADIAETDIVFWDSRNRKTVTLWREAGPATVYDLQWLPGTRSAFAMVLRPPQEPAAPGSVAAGPLLRIDTLRGEAHRIADVDMLDSISVSPGQPIGYLEVQDRRDPAGFPSGQTIARLTETGVGGPIRLPDGYGVLSWTADGRRVFSTRRVERTPDGGKFVTHKEVTVADLDTGAVTHPESAPAAAPEGALSPPPDLPLQITEEEATVTGKGGQAQRTALLWLAAKEKPAAAGPGTAGRLLVSEGGGRPLVLGDRGAAAALYFRDGALFAVPIFRVPYPAFADALKQAQKRDAMSYAKQIGLAIIGSSYDDGENLPANDGNLAGRIGPYLKNSALLGQDSDGTGFRYTYQGPLGLSQIGDVAHTQLGYFSTGAGQAILWADGHVTWQDPGP